MAKKKCVQSFVSFVNKWLNTLFFLPIFTAVIDEKYFTFPCFILQIFQTKAKLFFLLWSILNGRTMALLWNISWMGAIICAFRECGRSNTNQSVENWLGKCYWLDFNYCVQCVVVLTSFLSVGRNPKMPYFWLNVDPSAYSSGVSNSKVQILIVLSNT